MLKFISQTKAFDFKQLGEIKAFLNEYSFNFKKFSDLYELGKGGESLILRIEPFLPIEAVVKIPLISEEGEGDFDSLLLEDGYLRMAAH